AGRSSAPAVRLLVAASVGLEVGVEGVEVLGGQSLQGDGSDVGEDVEADASLVGRVCRWSEVSLGGQPPLQVLAEGDLLRRSVFAVVVTLDQFGEYALGLLASGAGGVPTMASFAGQWVDALVDDGVVAVALLGDVS